MTIVMTRTGIPNLNRHICGAHSNSSMATEQTAGSAPMRVHGKHAVKWQQEVSTNIFDAAYASAGLPSLTSTYLQTLPLPLLRIVVKSARRIQALHFKYAASEARSRRTRDELQAGNAL